MELCGFASSCRFWSQASYRNTPWLACSRKDFLRICLDRNISRSALANSYSGHAARSSKQSSPSWMSSFTNQTGLLVEALSHHDVCPQSCVTLRHDFAMLLMDQVVAVQLFDLHCSSPLFLALAEDSTLIKNPSKIEWTWSTTSSTWFKYFYGMN